MVDDGGAGLDGRLDHALEEALVRAARVLGIELDVLHVALRVAHAVDGPLYALVLVYDDRSEERRVGKECRSRWSPYH